VSRKERHEPATDAPDPDALTTATVGIVGAIRSHDEFQRKIGDVAPAEIRTLRAAQLTRLHKTGWVDKKNGIVAIPIEKAMELLVADPNPAAPVVGAKP
jgi:hypothetical protein